MEDTRMQSRFPEDIPIPQWQIEELQRRIAKYEKDPGSGMSWKDVKASILKQKSDRLETDSGPLRATL